MSRTAASAAIAATAQSKKDAWQDDRNPPKMTQVVPETASTKKQKLIRRRTTGRLRLRDEELSKPPMEGMRAQIRTCCDSPESSRIAKGFHLLFGILILSSLVFLTTETLNNNGVVAAGNLNPNQYLMVELFFTILFTVDLVVRGIVADRYCVARRVRADVEYHPPFFRDILNYCDLLSVLPLPMLLITGGTASNAVGMLSIFRVLRIFKVTRQFEGSKVLWNTAKTSAEPLVVSLFVLACGFFIVSSILFVVEPCRDKDQCEFMDVLNGAYFLCITLTSVGYGDQIPITTGGKLVAIVMMLGGAAYMAMPLAIIGNKFEDAYQRNEDERKARDEKRLKMNEEKEKMAQRSGKRRRHSRATPSVAESQMVLAQQVTRQERRYRAIQLGYRVLEHISVIVDDGANAIDGRETLTSLYADVGQLALDINVLYGLRYHENNADQGTTPKTHRASGSKLGGAFWAADPNLFNDPNHQISHSEHRVLQLLDLGKDHIVNLHRENERYLDRVRTALKRNTLRDRIWLCVDVPQASQMSQIYHWFSLFMTGMSILLVFAETAPELNAYGPETRMCKQVIRWHCKQAKQAFGDAGSSSFVENYPGCNANTDFGYSGCLDVNLPEIMGTCNHHANETIARAFQCGGDSNLTSLGFNTSLAFYNDAEWLSKNGLTDVCERVQCIDNNNLDYAAEFMALEILFSTWFLVELSLRFVSMRSLRSYFSSVANIFDVFAAVMTMAEVVTIPLLLGGFMYEVWTNPWPLSTDPGIMRVFRILVTIRFVTMQRHFAGLRVIKLTVSKVYRKLVMSFFFFFVFVILFASAFYTVEQPELYVNCSPGDPAPGANNLWKAPASPTNNSSTDGFCQKCEASTSIMIDDFSTDIRYNGTCTPFVTIPGEGGLILDPPLVNHMFDAIWTMIVTMTTVGYGGTYPRQSMGRSTSIVAAMFGSFYMAMPLAIIGKEFYSIYQDVDHEDAEKRLSLDAILQKERLQVNITMVSRLKNHATNARERLQQERLRPEEKEIALPYLAAVDSLGEDASPEALKDFRERHLKMMVVMSKSLIKKKSHGVFSG